MTAPDSLIDDFLKAVADLSPREAARVAGISFGSVAAWRRGDRKPLLAATRRKLREYLDTEEGTTKPRPVDGERLSFEERMDRLEAQAGGDLLLLSVARAELASVIRAEALRQGLTVSSIEAQAAADRAVAMKEWAAAMREAEQGARTRANLVPHGPQTIEELRRDVAHAAESLRTARESGLAEHPDQESAQPRAAAGNASG